MRRRTDPVYGPCAAFCYLAFLTAAWPVWVLDLAICPGALREHLNQMRWVLAELTR